MKLNVSKANIFSITCIFLVYIFLFILCLNNCYFWDTIQQVSKEAHWFYINDFKSLLIPTNNSDSDIMATGYHPPLMGIMTALLWKVFGYKLWVSHAFSLFWAIILFYNLWKLISYIFKAKHIGLILLILLTESAILAQFSISSPDFIILTAFVMSTRAILKNKPGLLAIGMIFLCCINMRGIFLAASLFISNIYFSRIRSNKNYKFKDFLKDTLPYLPAIILIASYYIYYLTTKGWFLTNSPYSEHYIMPSSWTVLLRHFISFFIRLLENGRIIIWFIFAFFIFMILKKKYKLNSTEKFLLLTSTLIFSIYFIFIFISQMPFSPRYFMPLFLLITILSLNWSVTYLTNNKNKILLILIIIFQITGNLWIYPEKIAKPWDCTLAHLPYYELRKECFDYIDNHKLNYNDISGGGNFAGNRLYVELKDCGIIKPIDTDKKYFIYSNISNLDDNLIDELYDNSKWNNIKTFQKWPIIISIYQKVN